MMRIATPTLSWFPPAPTPAPISILSLPPDDWSCESKQNGARTICLPTGEMFTRHGTPITKHKGVHLIRNATRGLPTTIDAEWCMQAKVLFIFDLPDHSGIYDERIAEIPDVIRAVGALSDDGISVQIIPRATGPFRDHYESWRAAGFEGVVLKRRNALYQKQFREGREISTWLKRRFSSDH